MLSRWARSYLVLLFPPTCSLRLRPQQPHPHGVATTGYEPVMEGFVGGDTGWAESARLGAGRPLAAIAGIFRQICQPSPRPGVGQGDSRGEDGAGDGGQWSLRHETVGGAKEDILEDADHRSQWRGGGNIRVPLTARMDHHDRRTRRQTPRWWGGLEAERGLRLVEAVASRLLGPNGPSNVAPAGAGTGGPPSFAPSTVAPRSPSGVPVPRVGAHGGVRAGRTALLPRRHEAHGVPRIREERGLRELRGGRGLRELRGAFRFCCLRHLQEVFHELPSSL